MPDRSARFVIHRKSRPTGRQHFIGVDKRRRYGVVVELDRGPFVRQR